jgi:hypothetical protein
VAIWADPRSFAAGDSRSASGGQAGSVDAAGTPTAFLWVHAVLIAVSLVTGTLVGWLGARGLVAARRRAADRREAGRQD